VSAMKRPVAVRLSSHYAPAALYYMRVLVRTPSIRTVACLLLYSADAPNDFTIIMPRMRSSRAAFSRSHSALCAGRAASMHRSFAKPWRDKREGAPPVEGRVETAFGAAIHARTPFAALHQVPSLSL